MHCVMSIGRRVRARTKHSEAAKALATRDHVRDISGLSAPSNNIVIPTLSLAIQSTQSFILLPYSITYVRYSGMLVSPKKFLCTTVCCTKSHIEDAGAYCNCVSSVGLGDTE
jgi:hypothetical protein